MSLVVFSILFFIYSAVPTPISYTLEQNWTFRDAETNDYRPAKVPGCVQLDLWENKLISDPFFGDNSLNLEYIENKNWEYKISFDTSPEILNHSFIYILFEGLDTHTEIKLNEIQILKTNNAFRKWRKDVRNLLKERNNTLTILFLSTLQHDLKKRSELSPMVNSKKIK
jgi:beta-mannosidase